MIRKATLFLVSALILLNSPMAFCLKEQEKEKVRKQISSVKAWQLTEDLNLSEEQAQVLFPAQKAYQEQKEELRKQREAEEKELDQLLEAKEKNRGLIQKKMARLKDIDKQCRANEDQFRKKISKILTVEQQAKYELFDKKFNTRLREMIRDIKREDTKAKSREAVKSESPPRQEREASKDERQSDGRPEKQVKKRDTREESKNQKQSSSSQKKSSIDRSTREKESSQISKSQKQRDDRPEEKQVKKREAREENSSKSQNSSGQKKSSNEGSSREKGSYQEESARTKRH
ncbi:MAG: hypothetical protein AMJ92_04410 [candidate division Zixibacteria bacterium SM23_81]|nr:MAG: hypothetical protein AMJ92_04410 [candidate division Zixibacteria bacterium SM23_81]